MSAAFIVTTATLLSSPLGRLLLGWLPDRPEDLFSQPSERMTTHETRRRDPDRLQPLRDIRELADTGPDIGSPLRHPDHPTARPASLTGTCWDDPDGPGPLGRNPAGRFWRPADTVTTTEPRRSLVFCCVVGSEKPNYGRRCSGVRVR